MPSETIYTFEDFQLDPTRKLLLRLPAGESVQLTSKAFQVLLYLVENNGELVTKDQLMTTVWHDSFVEDANLTQTISVLRRILGETPDQHRFIVTEPGKGYRFVAPVNEPETIEERSAARDQRSDIGRPFLFAFGAIVAVALLIGGYYSWSGSEAQVAPSSWTKEVKSIAVLPFKNIESSQDDQLLGIGMADAIITKLSHVKNIVVRQTNSVMRYADSTPQAIKVGREISVDAVLEGNIQKADGRIRVSVRLFRVSDGALLWAENFDERDTDIFALQDSISEKVATSLSLELNAEIRERLKRRYTENIEAYQLYNKGRFFWNNRNSEDLRKSISFFEQAIAKDAGYALAYSGMAESYVLLHLFGESQETEAFEKARSAAEKALSIDDNLAEAHNALAMYKAQHEWDWEDAELGFRRAIAINPSYATAHQTYGEFLGFMGRTNESIAEVETALKLDPLSLSTNTAQAFPYMVARRYDEAIEKLKPTLEMNKDFPLALFYLGRCYDGIGEHKQAIEQYEKAIRLSGRSTFFSSALINSLAKDGRVSEAEKKLAELAILAKTQPVSDYVIARAHAALGHKEKTLEILEQAYRTRASLMHVIRVDPNFDDLRGEPRFQKILTDMKLND